MSKLPCAAKCPGRVFLFALCNIFSSFPPGWMRSDKCVAEKITVRCLSLTGLLVYKESANQGTGEYIYQYLGALTKGRCYWVSFSRKILSPWTRLVVWNSAVIYGDGEIKHFMANQSYKTNICGTCKIICDLCPRKFHSFQL